MSLGWTWIPTSRRSRGSATTTTSSSPEGPSNGLCVAGRTPSGFEVCEQGNGTSDISFSYRIMTLRTDVRTRRLESVERPPSGAGEPVDMGPSSLPRLLLPLWMT